MYSHPAIAAHHGDHHASHNEAEARAPTPSVNFPDGRAHQFSDSDLDALTDFILASRTEPQQQA